MQILVALDRCPLTVDQLLKLSQTFDLPFQHERRVRRRLQALAEAGWIQSWPYAIPTHGAAPCYYQLTLGGYRILHGEEAQPPTKRYLAEIGVARHHHTKCLGDFIVHSAVAARRSGCSMVNFCRENTLRLDVGQESLYPDCSFQLTHAAHWEFNFFVELDNGTERVRSQKEVDSWQRKIRLYDQYQSDSDQRFRVLIVNTRSSDRLEHILRTAAQLVSNPQRSLFYGVNLAEYLASTNPLTDRCFRDHRGRRVALLVSRSRRSVPRPANLKMTAGAC